MRSVFIGLFTLGCATAATAEVSVSIPLANTPSSSVMSQTYACSDGNPLSVQYVNAGANALAIMTHEGEDRIFVNVVSASGAKYVSGASTWWSHGEAGTMETDTESGTTLECTLSEGASASE